MNPAFWRNRRVLLTGHTGFKGAWMAAILQNFGAEVTGLALPPDSEPSLSSLLGTSELHHNTADIRDYDAVGSVVRKASAEIVVHMAAQALVRRSYKNPIETFATNIMGTANVLQHLRNERDVRVILVVTSDKVYQNSDDGKVFAESDPLGGSDPYSASKAACELLVRSYASSFFDGRKVAVACARAGNVIGGGDFSTDRLVPDIYRSVVDKTPLVLRYPTAVRPWQHVLDCVSGYMAYVEYLHANGSDAAPALNFAPALDDGVTVAQVVSEMSSILGGTGEYQLEPNAPPEKRTLCLSAELAERILGWSPRLDLKQAMTWTAEWYAGFARGTHASVLVKDQIRRYLSDAA